MRQIVSMASTPMLSQQIRPRPGRRRVRISGQRKQNGSSFSVGLLVLALFLLCCCSGAAAASSEFGLERDDSLLRSTLERLHRSGQILVDTRPSPVVMDSSVPHLEQRQATHHKEDDSKDDSKRPSPTTIAPDSTSIAASTQSGLSTSAIVTAPSTPSKSPLPRPFDTSLGSNFTAQSCPNFFASFLANSTFKACLPFSLLLQNSNSFFQAERSIVRITQTLDATCNVNFNTCSSLMSGIAQALISDQNCGQDYQQQNPLVTQAYSGLIAYEPLYQAGCLRSDSGSYCFADAITNQTNPSDSYIYYIALGMSLPGGSSPTCDKCLQDTMSIFANAASNSSQPISHNYVMTAQQLDLNCGPTYVNASIPVSHSSAVSRLTVLPTPSGLGLWTLTLVLFGLLI